MIMHTNINEDTEVEVEEVEDESLAGVVVKKGEAGVEEGMADVGEFDLEKAVSSLPGPDIAVVLLDGTISRISALVRSVQMMLARTKSGKAERMAGNTAAYWADMKLFLFFSSKIEGVNESFCKATKFDGTLKAIANPEYKMPAEHQTIAAAIVSNFAAINWGSPATAAKGDDEDEEEEQGLSAAGPSRTGRRNASRRNSTALAADPRAAASSTPWRSAPSNHPIFGDNGIMHHFQARKVQQSSLRIDPTYQTRDFRVFGNNTLVVGDTWYNKLALRRDGAHGSIGGGISGTTNEGCYSIVITGQYSEIDKDAGHEVLYSAPGSENSTSATPDGSKNGVKALERSINTQRHVRVFRGPGSWAGAPKEGFRYDGLYKVVGRGTKQNALGGQYYEFLLRRQGNQAAIDTSRPTAKEKRAFGDAAKHF